MAGAILKSGSVENEAAVRGFLTFDLGPEQYAVEILKVQEIGGVLPITRVPNTKRYLKGLVNLRGKIIPVVDLRLRFDMEEAPVTEESCIIFAQVRGVELGLLVDRVADVLEIPEADIEADPTQSSDCLMGIGKVGDKAKLLLNLEKVCEIHE
ncbi:MAG TPA: chemotaxis protein CheW [Acidobacteriota bacterium]|jgi:purine-binding chemotaxis protein CheW|nr:chemotaxis protein CheW [Acidobacteriota bacterium]HRR25094.1 chemotaxis protein CheW [Acidobacteriota bacterium]HRR55484.1 chemotaxis protein CheW [Acidobacteriota bacterium]HRV07077.1 chemotaxis protein CheW [Acidobacteriota bacterium]